MLKLLEDLKVYLKWQDITTDTMIFRMHSQFTMVMLLMCSMVLTATQYVGNQIACIVEDYPDDARRAVETYCWISSTFLMPDTMNNTIGTKVSYPGHSNEYSSKTPPKYYAYYQWVCFMLFFQAMMCYVPQWLWNTWERGFMKDLVMGMNHGLCQTAERQNKKSLITEYIQNYRSTHIVYVCRYYFCEALCLVNILVQLYLMYRFFDGEFLGSTGKLWQIMLSPETSEAKRYDGLIYIFPRVTKCDFHKYGPTGTIEKKDVLCILPLNIINEKIYVFLWFWYLILTIMLVGLLAYRAAIIFAPSIRARLMHFVARGTSKETCQRVSRKTDLGDWWVLYNLGYNLDGLLYRDLLQDLAEKIGDQNSPSFPQ